MCQITPLNGFAEALDGIKSEKFTPAIEVDPTPKKKMTNEEMQNIYEEFKSKIQKDIDLQKGKIKEYKLKEEASTKTVTSAHKSVSIEQKILSQDISLKSYSVQVNSDFNTMSTLNSVTVPEAPQNLDAMLSGDKVILTWIPSEGADGYNIYRGTTKIQTTTQSVFDEGRTLILPTPSDYTIYVKAYVLDDNGQEVESTQSNQIVVGYGSRDISTNFTLSCDYVYENVNITGGKFDLNGNKFKVCGVLSQSNAEVDVNNGKLIAFKSYTIQGSSKLRMNDEFDYVYVGGEFYFNTSITHDQSYLNNGILQVEGNVFQVNQLGVFRPDGKHKVYLTNMNTAGITTVGFNGSDNTSQFNILAINKPFSMYQFQPLPPTRSLSWYKQLVYFDDKDKYSGIEGVYSPTGNLGRNYTDLVIPTRGLDITIGRSYSSRNTRAGMLGVGWTFSYEGSIETYSEGNMATFFAPDGSTMNFSLRSNSGGDKIYDGMDSRAELYYYQSTNRYVLKMRDRTQYGFDMVNGKYRMSYIEDYRGNRITIEFYTSGKINKIKDQDGRQVTLAYTSTKITLNDTTRTITYNLNADGKPYTVTDAIGNIVYTYGYDSNKFLNSVKLTEGGVMKQVDQLVYNNIGKIQKWTDINGKITDYYYEPGKTTVIYTVNNVKRKTIEEYDECFAINKIIEDDGTSNIVEYFTENIGDISINKYNEIKSQKDNNGNVTTYERDIRGNVTKIINPDTSSKSFGNYSDDARKDLLQWELDESGTYIYYEYSNERTLLKKYVYRTPVTSEPYPVIGNLNQSNSIITTYTYKTDGQIESVLEPNQYGTTYKTIYEYNTNGTLKKITDPEGKSISYTYNSYGLTDSEIITLNGYSTYMSTWYEYDKNGRVLRKTLCDSNSLTTASNKSSERFVYDNIGRLIQKISPNLYNPSNDTLDASGKVCGSYQLTNVGYRYEYKGATENITKETDPEGNIYLYQYDENGNVINKTLPDSNTIGGSNCTNFRYVYDGRNRLLEVYGTPYGKNEIIQEVYTYLPPEYIQQGHFNAYVMYQKNLNHFEWSKEIKKYDYGGRILEEVKNPGPNEVKISQVYNPDGTVKSSKDGEGYVTHYFYNAVKKPVHIWVPCEGTDGTTTYYTYKRMVYDDSGNVVNEGVKTGKIPNTAFDSVDLREIIHTSDLSSGFHVSTNTYYKNNLLKTSTGFTGERKQYYYDGANLLNKLEQFKDETTTNKKITDYTNNYLGKVAVEKNYVRKVDIYNSGSQTNDSYTITKNCFYDKNGNLTTISEPIYYTMKMFYYDNLNRVCGNTNIGYQGSYSESTSKVLNWEGKPLSETNKRGYTTIYTYDWKGLPKKTVQSVTQYNPATGTYSLNDQISMYWYDNGGRLIADVSPNNYTSSMDGIENIIGTPTYLCNNYNYYKYDTLGRIIQKGFIGQKKVYNSTTSTWSVSQNDTYKSYTYNKNGQILTEVDEESNVTQYKYTPQGKIMSVLDPENKDRNLAFTTSYVYDTMGRVLQEKYIDSLNNETGRIITYEYTTQNVGSVINTYTVKKKVNLTDNAGVIEVNVYDLLGNVITHTECKGGESYNWNYEYNNFGKVSLVKEPYNSTTQVQKKLQYNSLGILVYMQNMMQTPTDTQDDVCELYNYNIVSEKLLTSCHQNYNGTDAITTSATYDKNGNQITSTDGNNVTVTYTYDEVDRKISQSVTVNSVAHTDVYDYDFNGNVIRTVDWRGNSWKYSYDSRNRLYEKRDPNNAAIEKLEYNNRNLQISSYDGLNKKTQYTYDKNKRLLSTIDPLNHTVSQTYDNLGNIKEKIDGKNNKIVYKYDIMNRVKEVYDSTELKTSYTYYIDGALKEQKIGNATTNYVTTYTYNAFGEVETITDPTETGVPTTTETYEYYPTGTIKSKVDRNGKTTSYEYDCHDRMIKKTAGDSNNNVTITIPDSSEGYDGNGNVKTIILQKTVSGTVVSTITTERTYDVLNRVTEKIETSLENGVSTECNVEYEYDITIDIIKQDIEQGEIKEKAIYPNGVTVEKIYDNVGRLKSVSDEQKTIYQYDINGRRQSVIYNDTFKQEYTYYDNGLLQELKNLVKDSSGNYVESEYYKYYYDEAHNMIQKDERLSGISKTTEFEYDSMNRLKKVSEPLDKNTEYTYDSRGNRQSVTVKTPANTIITYTLYEYTNNNRLKYETKRNSGSSGTIIQKKQYIYDNNGNLTTVKDITGTPSVITTNTYTLLNQLENSTTAGKTMKNTYNAEGKRVSKILNTGAPTRYFYEGNKAVFEYANGGTVTAFNVIGTNLISRKIGTNKVYYFYNGHGDVTALLDASTKKIRSQYAYDAFGNVTNEKYYDSNGILTTNPAQMIKSPIRYGEYQYDSETEYTGADGKLVTGLYYLNARHYDPGTARFLEMDTYTGDISDPLSLNLYSYCRNEPIMYTDPTGHYTEGKVFSYEPGQKQYYDPDVWELQQDLIKLGRLNRSDIPAGQEGFYGPITVGAVNAFKDKYLRDGNQGNNRGKFGDTTWLFIKREVKLKNLQGTISTEYIAKRTTEIWNEFNTAYNKLIGKSKPSSATHKTTYDYGRNISQSQSKNTKTVVYLPEYMNKVVKDMGLEKAIEIYYIQSENKGVISKEDANRLGLDWYGVGLLESSYKLNTAGMTVVEYDFIDRQKNYEAAKTLMMVSAVNATIANSNNSPKVSEPNGGVKYPTNNQSKGTPKTNPVGGGCFTAGTLVSTEDGQRPIEEVKVGDYVWSENPETGEKGLKKVVNTFIHDKYTLIYVYTGDTMIETTEEHPFWVEDKGWVFAGELNEGDVLRLKSGENIKVTKLERVDLKEPVKVYNFEVQDWHTYYVSDINVLVHNKAAMKEPTNIKMLDDKFIKKKGFDPHTVKSDALGTNKDLDKFDIYLDKDTGQMWVYRKGGKGMGQPTGEYIK